VGGGANRVSATPPDRRRSSLADGLRTHHRRPASAEADDPVEAPRLRPPADRRPASSPHGCHPVRRSSASCGVGSTSARRSTRRSTRGR
jgi:hypothetical protein